MKEVLLLKDGEIALKGLNRATFEDKLIKNARRRLASTGNYRFYKAQSTIYCEPLDDKADTDEAMERLSTVFGLSAYCRAGVMEKDFSVIQQQAPEYLADQLQSVRTFKVEAKRSDKAFPMKSPEICAELGGVILEKYPHLKVDVNQPDLIVTVEIREKGAYVHAKKLPGAGGLPVGTSGRAALLISGGIDSPVAAYMMAKRGLELTAIHFVSPPYTSGRAKLKVVSLVHRLWPYCGRVTLFCVDLREIQEAIRDRCPEELFTVIMRRYMMRISEQIARRDGCPALITGESLAQVASQTLQAIACTDASVSMPVLRPLIGMDKEEIISVARRIGTFEISIEPYEDCCTVFTPRHPKTRPVLGQILEAEEKIKDGDAMIARALETVELIVVNENGAKGYIE